MHRSAVVVPSGIFRRSSFYFCWALPLFLRISAPPSLFCHAFVVPPAATLSSSSRSRNRGRSWSHSHSHTRSHGYGYGHTHGTLARRWLVSAPTDDRSSDSDSEDNGSDSDSDSDRDWSLLRVVDLRDELRSRGLKVSGRKAELVALLEEDDAASAASASASRSAVPSSATRKTRTTMTRRSTRTRAGTKRGAEEREEKNPPNGKQSKTADTDTDADADADADTANNKDNTKPSPSSKKKPKAGDHQRITEIDELPKLWNQEMARENGSYTFKIASWNVAGLRALIKKSPTALSDLCSEHDLDMLCLQEHKLQETHLNDPKLGLRGMMESFGYDEYWSCSTVKKGYSGTCVFVRRRRQGNEGSGSGSTTSKQGKIGSFFAPKKKKTESEPADDQQSTATASTLPEGVSPELLTPTRVTYSIGQEIDNEGRVVLLDFPWATIANVYVPNSGQKLERLDYRTQQWDKFFVQFLEDHHSRRESKHNENNNNNNKKKNDKTIPLLWLGDLNIAHKALDVWNDGAKHLAKQAGVTDRERASFSEQLASGGGFVDVFRKLHPTARGNYSYWSQRAGNRGPNKGLRLDYFVVSERAFDEATSGVIPRDSYVIRDKLGSDHAPVVLELELKPEALEGRY